MESQMSLTRMHHLHRLTQTHIGMTSRVAYVLLFAAMLIVFVVIRSVIVQPDQISFDNMCNCTCSSPGLCVFLRE